MSKTWCILSSNTLFVFVADATMGWDCCWIVVVTPGLLNVTRQKIHWPRVRIISSAPLCVTAPEQIGDIVSLCSERVLSLALSRQMLIGLINLNYHGQDVLNIIFLWKCQGQDKQICSEFIECIKLIICRFNWTNPKIALLGFCKPH